MKKVALLLTVLLMSAAQEAKSDGRLIEELGSDDIEVRDTAEAAIRKRGKEALAAVEKALASTRNPEVKARLQGLVGFLKVPHEGGSIVDGLRFHLLADKKKARPGEAVALKLTIWNLTDRPRNLDVGYSTCGIFFECGSNIEVLAPKEEISAEPEWHALSCGMGAGPLTTTIPAYGCRTFETQTSYFGPDHPSPPDTKSRRPLTRKAHYTFKSVELSLEAPKGDVHRLRVKSEAGESRREDPRRSAGTPPFDPAAAPWTGTAWSNEVQLKILPPKE